MSRSLEIGSLIILCSGGIKTEFIIDQVIGIGGSCIAYSVTYHENDSITHKGILKEYCPAYLDNDGTFERDGYSVVVPEKHKPLYESELIRFRDTYKTINNYLAQNMSAVNFHTVQLGLYEGNNTLYTLTSCDYGQSYDKITDSDIHSVLKLMLSVTKAVEMYHNAGYLHLDIKPKNILILDDVTDLVKLFDFDSLTPIDELRLGNVSAIPVPEDYYVPELTNFEIRNIGIHTDIFEIGAMLFSRIFGRAPMPAEMNRDVKYDFDSAKILDGVAPQAKHELDVLLRHTVQVSRRGRYRTTLELKEQLNKLIILIGEDAPYIANLPRWQPALNTVGRQDELIEIKRRLDNDGYVFVRGIGGLGKSEIAKMFAAKYADTYHTVQFCKYSDSLNSLIAAMPVNGIDDNDYKNPDDLVREKLKVLHRSDSRTLIVVDNFNTTHDKKLRDFLPNGNSAFKVIFTTRCIPAADYYQEKVFELPKLSDEDCTKLFYLKSSIEETTETRQLISQIVDIVKSNTLILVLLAGTVNKNQVTLAEIIDALDNQELSEIGSVIFHEYDYSEEDIEEYNRIYAHLNTIFSVSGLSDIENMVLKNMSLVSQNGMPLADFLQGCNCDSVTESIVNSLSNQGWVEMNEMGRVSLHPIISDLIADNDTIRGKSYYQLFEWIDDFCSEENQGHFSKTLEQFACALQLDRRTKNDDIEYKIAAKITLCLLYKEMYRPKDARKCIDEIGELAKEEDDSSAGFYIFVMRGDIEAQFGSPKTAINNYQKAIDELDCFEDDEIEIAELRVAVMEKIAACYADNSEYQEAYDEYKEVYEFVTQKNMTDMIRHPARRLSEICIELEKNEESAFYSDIADRFYDSSDIDDSQDSIKLRKIIQSIKNAADEFFFGDFEKGFSDVERTYSEARDHLGEESPAYKEMISESWTIYALASDKPKTMRAIAEDLDFVASTYGENSLGMAERLACIAMTLPEYFVDEINYATDCAKHAILICENLNEMHVYAYFQARLALSKCLIAVGKRDEAVDLIKAIDFYEFSGGECLFDIINNAGRLLVEISEYDLLETLCKELFKRKSVENSSKQLPYLLMAWCYFSKGQISNGAECLDKAKELIDQLADFSAKKDILDYYHRSVANMYYCKGDYNAAIRQMDIIINSFENVQEYGYKHLPSFTERGLYYTCNAQYDDATNDYELCIKILTESNYPPEAFLVLYNDIAVNYSNQKIFDQAIVYLNKIIDIRPGTINPISMFDAIVCSNLGWSLSNLGNHIKGISFLKKAVYAYELLDVENSKEMYAAKRNLAAAYEKSGNLRMYLKINEALYEEVDRMEHAQSGDSKSLIACDLVVTYLENGKEQKAYDFAYSAERRFAELFGEGCDARVELLLRFGDIFKAHGYREWIEFISLADKTMQMAGMKESIYYARALNYIGIYVADTYERYSDALSYLEESKALFEKLGEEEHPLYAIVLQNIKYVNDKILDRLLDDFASMYINNSEEEE